MQNYHSKRSIYKDFPIAIKFVLAPHNPFSKQDYAQIRHALSQQCSATLDEISNGIAGMGPSDPTSVGYFVEIPSSNFMGRESLVLLEHETGVELFVEVDASVMAALWPWLLNLLCGWLAGKALDRLARFLRKRLSNVLGRQVCITHVEIRTEYKGAIRVALSAFRTSQIRCLVKKFPDVSHLRDCHTQCFGVVGEVVDD